VNRAANADRDIASSEASDATVQSRAGSRWMSASARPMWASCSAPSQPRRADGSVRIQERIAWMTRMSPSRVITASPPGRSSRASAASRRSRLSIHSDSGAPASMRMITGNRSTIVRAAGWSNRTAPQISSVGSPPFPWRRIS